MKLFKGLITHYSLLIPGTVVVTSYSVYSGVVPPPASLYSLLCLLERWNWLTTLLPFACRRVDESGEKIVEAVKAGTTTTPQPSGIGAQKMKRR